MKNKGSRRSEEGRSNFHRFTVATTIVVRDLGRIKMVMVMVMVMVMNTPIMKTTMREGLVGARHGNGSTHYKEESEQYLYNKKQIQIYQSI